MPEVSCKTAEEKRFTHDLNGRNIEHYNWIVIESAASLHNFMKRNSGNNKISISHLQKIKQIKTKYLHQ